jgi:hypothetical protein
MDVVKTRIGQLNGTVEIDSEKGKGSRLSIRVPLTLAIMPTLMVVLGKQPFALPLGSVSEIFNLDLKRTNVVDGQLVVMVREKALPLFYLRKWLVRDHNAPEPEGPAMWWWCTWAIPRSASWWNSSSARKKWSSSPWVRCCRAWPALPAPPSPATAALH